MISPTSFSGPICERDVAGPCSSSNCDLPSIGLLHIWTVGQRHFVCETVKLPYIGAKEYKAMDHPN